MSYKSTVKRAQVKAGKVAIGHLIKAINNLTDTSNDIGKIKANIENKRVNFINVMALIKDIYSQSLKDSESKANKKWLYNTVNELLDAAKEAIDNMIDILNDNIDLSSAKNDNEVINYSNAKKNANENINLFSEYITDLEAMISGDKIEEELVSNKKTFKGGYCEKYHQIYDRER